ncbi:MAG TPA: Nudix family hydrolase [Rhodanobacteraceae bacterium]|nr:Nudix family hydrolase [Rhodanobacteraceae bacterium]
MIDVAAGVLGDAQGRVLLMQRLPGTHLAGLWEFPGGKFEPGENAAQALTRELHEELGIATRGLDSVISLPWRYPEKTIRLHALRVTAWEGEPRAREGHPLRWVPIDEIDPGAMPPADRPILAALRLPRHYAISPAGSDDAAVLAWLQTQQPGDSLIQLRLPERGRAALRALIQAALDTMPWLRNRLLLNHDIELAREFGIGLHLRASQLREWRQRPVPENVWAGASCHDRDELDRAAEIGADFATLSPVRATPSHPHAAPLGWDCFATLVAEARLPVYALGGVRVDDLGRAREIGAQGVAGISAFARA